MPSYIRNIALVVTLAIAGAFAQSCAKDMDRLPDNIPDGYCRISVGIGIPTMEEVQTRAVDPDGAQGVQLMDLFCFDSYGLFISTVRANLTIATPTDGKLTADIPRNTKRIHFLSNQNLTNFSEDSFRGKSEQEVISILEGSAGKMIYWGRFQKSAEDADKEIGDALQGKLIKLIRNQAKVTVESQVSSVVVEGFAVCNTHAFGTVAPFSSKTTSYFPTAEEFTSDEWSEIVTLPENKQKLTDPSDIDTAPDGVSYIYESENDSSDPVSVIIKANGLYYRTLIIREDGEQAKIRRNYHYIMNIIGELSYGQESFAKALKAAATNNVWLSISDDVETVTDGQFRLSVKPTNLVLDESQLADDTYRYPKFDVSLTRLDGKAITKEDAPSVKWVNENNVAQYNFINGFDNPTISGSEMSAVIQPTLLDLGSDARHSGTLLVKHGRLQRKINIIVIKKQTFTPVWITSQLDGNIYPGAPIHETQKSFITLMFHIPETCPEELYPFDVLISAAGLDIRNASGMQLPLIFKNEDGFGADHGVEYKYVYTVRGPGDHSVYFRNVLQQNTDYKGEVWLDANHFGSVSMDYSYTNNLRRIDLSNLKKYNASNTPEGSAADEDLYYYLVPQKRNAEVSFELLLTDKATGAAVDPNIDFVEFFAFTTNLEHNTAASDFEFQTMSSDQWTDRGRMLLFWPKSNHAGTPDAGKYNIEFTTNRAKSNEVVRISSNMPGYDFYREHPGLAPSAKYADMEDGSHGYGYRSAIFRLVNYRPFRFFAEVNGVGTNLPYEDIDEHSDISEWSDVEPEAEDEIVLEYTPDEDVDIEIDISSFKGMDGKSVDPFGESFEVYIDAPMLEIDADRLIDCNLTADKLKADPLVAGRFIYTVDADREAERTFGVADPHANHIGLAGVNRTNERKRLPFKKKTIVSTGQIVISSEAEVVTYLEKVFNVSNNLITGTIKFGEDAGSAVDIPGDNFVSFAMKDNGYRIGAMSITETGKYSLKLRSEYNYNWFTDAVEIRYSPNAGESYVATVNSLRELYENREIILIKEK
ncbi:MAG: hypothetical protein ACI3Y2_07075 [Candidatus Egerieousia sp.]